MNEINPDEGTEIIILMRAGLEPEQIARRLDKPVEQVRDFIRGMSFYFSTITNEYIFD